MHITVTESIFRDYFNSIRPDNFSYDALGLLFEFFEYEDFEFDVIGICCDFEEADADEVRSYYDLDEDDYPDDDSVEEWLKDRTMVIGTTGSGFVFQSF